ncbi:energy-coupling factor transporter transmembrane component T [Clostridium sp.]|uniref:energy-coupling factor transporter transmembrane component T family protein n=1 Tax=Clostridium sp. TaxID=1506 RepID=UPI00321754F4
MLKTVLAYSKLSKLSNIHPIEKILLCILPIIALSFSTKCYALVINIIFFLALHIIYKNPLHVVRHFVEATFIFALVSSITFVFDYGWYNTLILILKAVSGGMTVSFLTLTTPTDHIFYLGSKKPWLRDICDIGKSMERFLVLIYDEFQMLRKAMICRGAFGGFKDKVKDSGTLASLLFINTLNRWKEIKDGIDSRGYKGNIYYRYEEFDLSYKRIVLIVGYVMCLIILVSIPKYF